MPFDRVRNIAAVNVPFCTERIYAGNFLFRVLSTFMILSLVIEGPSHAWRVIPDSGSHSMRFGQYQMREAQQV